MTASLPTSASAWAIRLSAGALTAQEYESLVGWLAGSEDRLRGVKEATTVLRVADGLRHSATARAALTESLRTRTLILTRNDISQLMTPADYLAAVKAGFLALAAGHVEAPIPLHLHGAGGGFHAKGAVMRGSAPHAAIKINANFPNNPLADGLPTIQGVIVLADATNGRIQAVMDSAEVTLRRTAAATAVAAEACAAERETVIAVCGAGAQGRAQLEAIADVLKPTSVRVWDQDTQRAAFCAEEMSQRLHLAIKAPETVDDAIDDARVILACTSAREPYLHPGNVRRGTFIAAVGADNPEKSELAPALMAVADVVTDVTEQCRIMGDLHHAIAAGVMTVADVRAELADLVAGRKTVRCGADHIVVFDSTGTAVQDVASAFVVYERAFARGVGTAIDFLSTELAALSPSSPLCAAHS